MTITIDDILNNLDDNVSEPDINRKQNFEEIFHKLFLGTLSKEAAYVNNISSAATFRGLLQDAMKYFEEYFPKNSFKELLLLCDQHKHPRIVYKKLDLTLYFNESEDLKKEALELLLDALCYSLCFWKEVTDPPMDIDKVEFPVEKELGIKCKTIVCINSSKDISIQQARDRLTQLASLKTERHGKSFSKGRAKGAKSEHTRRIEALVKEEPGLSTVEYMGKYEKKYKKTIESQEGKDSFANTVSKIRTQLNCPRKTTKKK